MDDSGDDMPRNTLPSPYGSNFGAFGALQPQDGLPTPAIEGTGLQDKDIRSESGFPSQAQGFTTASGSNFGVFGAEDKQTLAGRNFAFGSFQNQDKGDLTGGNFGSLQDKDVRDCPTPAIGSIPKQDNGGKVASGGIPPFGSFQAQRSNVGHAGSNFGGNAFASFQSQDNRTPALGSNFGGNAFDSFQNQDNRTPALGSNFGAKAPRDDYPTPSSASHFPAARRAVETPLFNKTGINPTSSNVPAGNHPSSSSRTPAPRNPWGCSNAETRQSANPWERDKTENRMNTVAADNPWVSRPNPWLASGKDSEAQDGNVAPSQIAQLWGTARDTPRKADQRERIPPMTLPGPASQLPNVNEPASQSSPAISLTSQLAKRQVHLESWATWLLALSWLDLPFDRFHLGRESDGDPPKNAKSFFAEHNAQSILDHAYLNCCGTVPFMMVLVEEVVITAYDIVVRARDPTGCIGICLHRAFIQAVPNASHLGTVLFLRDVSFLRIPTNLQGDLETYCVVTMPSFVHAIAQNDVPPDVTKRLRDFAQRIN